MAWTAAIIKVTKFNEETLKYEIDYNDGNITRKEFMQVKDPTAVTRAIKARIAKFEAVDAVLASPPVGPVDLTETPLTPEEIAKQVFLTDYRKLQAMKAAIVAGIKTEADVDYVALLAKIKAEFLDAYLPLIGGKFPGV